MNKNMAAGHVLAVLLQISLVCFNTFYVISATKCADKDCKVPISMAVAVKDYESGNEKYLSFKKGDVLSIYGKYVEGDNSIWQGSLRGMPAKFLRSDLVKEKVKFVNEDKLIDVFPNSASEGLLKDTENDGGPLESQQHAEEEQDLANEDDSVADMPESRDVFSEDPSTTDDQSKVEELDPGLNEAPNEEDDEATLGAANEGEDGGKPNQEELANENKVEPSQTGQENVLTNDGEALDDEDTNPQSTMEDNDEDVVDKTKKTEVYTDPTGVQYDVQIEYFDPAERDNNEGVKVVGVTEQPQSNVDEDDLPEKAVTDKGTVDNPETPSSDEDNRQLKKNGFFSSVRNLVSDFTENIIKDFQGEEQLKGKETKNQLDGGIEETVNDEVTNDGEQREAEVESQKDETNTKPSFHERLQQIKAARVEEIKDKEEVKKDSRMSSRIDEEEVLKEKAKRTVEEIPGLMKEDKNEASEAAGEQMLNQNTVSQGNGAGSQEAPQKQYSDKVLCKSVPVKEREVCMASGSKEECLQDNCCYDESAAPGQQCFFKPSAPESGFSDEELQKLLSDNDEKVPMKNENDVELSDSGKSITKQASETADVSSESKKELNDIQVYNEKKLESVDQGTGNGDSTGETNLVKSNEDLDSRTEVNEPDDGSYKSKSVNKTHGSSLKDSSLEKSPTAEAIESTTTSGTKQAVEGVSEGKEDYKQKDTTTGGTAEPENTADEAKSDSEETEGGGEAIATGVKTSAESDNKDDISNEDKTIVNKQQPSGGGVLTNETSVDSQEVRRSDSDSEEVDELTTAGSSVGTDNEKSSMGNIAEEHAVENRASEVKSAQDSENDPRSAQDSENDPRSAQDSEDDKSSAQASLASLGDVEEKGISSAGEKMISEARESGEKEVEQELKHSSKKGEENEGDGESRDKNNGDVEDGDENKDGSGENRSKNKEVGGKDRDKNKEVGVEGADENKEVGGEDADQNKEVGGEDADQNKKVGGEDEDKNKEVGVEGGGNKQGDGEVSDESKNVKETKVDDDVELESNGGDPKSNSSSQQELSGKESISDESNDGESQMSEAKITESAGRADEIEHPHQESTEKPSTQDFASSETAAAAAETSSVKDIPREKEETLPEYNVDKKHDDVPDAEGIFNAIKKFLPGRVVLTRQEDTKSNGQTSDEVLAMKKPVISENDNDRGKVHEHSQESNKNIESIMRENVKNDEANLKTDHLQENSEIEEADSIEDVSDEDFDKSQTSAELESEKMLKALLEEESLTSHDAARSEISIPDTEVEREIENKSVESGSTRFLDVSEKTLPVEKTGGVNGSSSQESEATDTGIKEANEVKETITGTDDIGVNGTEPGVNKTSKGSDVVPSKTSAVGPSETITTDYRTEEKKFPNIAAKWMTNTLIKGKRMAQKGTELGTSEGVDEKLDAENVDKGQHTGNLDGSLDLEDPYSGTCVKDGTCEGGTPFSRSVSLNGDNLADDDIVEPSPRKEESKVRRGTLQKYHDLAAEYVLPLLKPVGNVVKSLGEQMGLGETVDYLELKIEHGPTGVVSVPLILIAFLVYFMLCFLCRPKVPPSYGPNLKDIFLTYEGRIRILEEDCSNYEEEIKNLKNKVDEDGENSSVLGKQLEEERHERHKSNEQISLLKKIHKELNEKVNLLEEESANLKQSLAQKTECVNTVEEELTEKSNEVEAMEEKNKQLEDQLREKDGEKNVLNEQIEEYKTQLSKAEDDTDRHKTMLQDWNDRYHELQQKNDDISVNNQTLEEQIHFKDNEIEVLREALVQINSDVHINSDEELPQEEMQEAKAKKVKELMDVSQIRTDYKLCKEEKEKLEDDIKEEVEEREKLEGKVEQLEIDLAKSKASEEEMRFKYREADIKLNALQDYFKNMESDLHRKLTAEEAARMASESELERKLREASTAVQDVELYRKQVEELRKEIDETQLSFRSQISSTEERAHENWLKFRTAERELEEMRRERDALRRRLYDLETAVKAPAPLEDSLTSTTTDNLESPQPRSESPATSIRSSKRKSSNPRKSPSGSPMDERKERVRRKTRDRNSPPSWEADMGPPPRRRDKDRVTPPPPPSLWEPNMGSRRKGQRESPGMDTERKRRDRYTPSPPPPPENSRRRRRDRPTPSSSPPPPPPPAHVLPPRRTGIPLERSSSPPPPPPAHVLSSRGMRMPLERSSSPPPPPPPAHVLPPRGTGMPLGRSSSPPPPAHVLSPAGLQGFAVAPMRAQGPMNAPFSRPPQDMMAPRPVRNGVPRAPFGNTPPPRYIRGGVGIPEQRVRGPPPTSEFPGTSPARYAGPPLVNTVSPPRGMQPQGVASYEQSPLYNNSNFSNNTPVNDQPPPPPLFASNGPYRRPPPRKIQTQPS